MIDDYFFCAFISLYAGVLLGIRLPALCVALFPCYRCPAPHHFYVRLAIFFGSYSEARPTALVLQDGPIAFLWPGTGFPAAIVLLI